VQQKSSDTIRAKPEPTTFDGYRFESFAYENNNLVVDRSTL